LRKKILETTKPPLPEDSEIGCLAKFDDQTIYGASNFKDNTITLYIWSSKPPYNRKKEVLQINEPNNIDQISKLCNPDPFPIKIHFSKDYLFIAINKYIFIFSKANNHAYHGVLDEHKSRITAIVESRGKVWTASRDCSIRLWEISDTKKASCLSALENAHDGEVLCMAIVGNQQVISGGADFKIRSRSAKSNTLDREREKEFKGIHDNYIECLFWEQKSKYLWVSSLDKSISIWS